MDNKTLVSKLIDDVFNKRDVSNLSKYCAANCVSHDALATTIDVGGLRQVFEGYLSSFSDMRVVIDSQISEGDLVATRVTATGTDTGGFMGRPPTRKKIQISGIQFDRVRDGRIAETWVQMDYLSMMQQLGMVPRFELTKPGPAQHPYS